MNGFTPTRKRWVDGITNCLRAVQTLMHIAPAMDLAAGNKGPLSPYIITLQIEIVTTTSPSALQEI
jgi:hypothetical protein